MRLTYKDHAGSIIHVGDLVRVDNDPSLHTVFRFTDFFGDERLCISDSDLFFVGTSLFPSFFDLNCYSRITLVKSA